MSRKTLFDDEGNVQNAEEEEGDGTGDDDDDPFAKADSGSSGSSVRSNEVRSSDSEELDQADYTDLRAEDFVDADGDDPNIDSDEAFGSGEEKIFKSKGFVFQGSKRDLAPEDSSEGDSDEDGALVWDTEDEAEVDSDQDMEMDDAASSLDGESQELSGGDSDSDLDSNTSPEPASTSTTDREKLKLLLTNDAAAVASTLSASANADGQKGQAVKQQYQTFDRLLDARIKLQKGITAADSISLAASPDAEVLKAVQSAEAAALKLFSTIESIRHSIFEVASGATSKKRKRSSPTTPSTSASALWTRVSNLEDQSLPQRRAILNKWSSKTRSANGISAPRSQLDRSTHQDTITDILDAQITSENQKEKPSGACDDTAFYQSLLRDLISSRASLSQSQNIVSDTPLPSVPKQHRKGVDPKASKGRKIRYTVHEKLQNFTAEEDRGTWTESAKREFFASLFGGQGRMLDEDAEVEDGDDFAGDEDALRLFRS